MRNIISIIACLLLLSFTSCSKSPLEKIQNIAAEAQKNAKDWSEEDWVSKCEAFQKAAFEFIKSDPNKDDIEAFWDACGDLERAAGKSSISNVYSILEKTAEKINEESSKMSSIKGYDAVQQGLDEVNDEMEQGLDEVNDAMEQGLDEVNDAAQQSLEEIED